MKKVITAISLILSLAVLFSFGAMAEIIHGDVDIDVSESDCNHQWGNWSVITPATCSAKGKEQRICSIDTSHIEQRDIDINPNAHSFGDWVSISDTQHKRVCKYNSEHTEVAQHNIEGDRCTVCNYVKPGSFIPGDIDNSGGTPNLNDVTRLAQYVAKWNVTVVVAALDPDGSGSVNLNDVTHLAQKVARWDVTLSTVPYVPKN